MSLNEFRHFVLGERGTSRVIAPQDMLEVRITTAQALGTVRGTYCAIRRHTQKIARYLYENARRLLYWTKCDTYPHEVGMCHT